MIANNHLNTQTYDVLLPKIQRLLKSRLVVESHHHANVKKGADFASTQS